MIRFLILHMKYLMMVEPAFLLVIVVGTFRKYNDSIKFFLQITKQLQICFVAVNVGPPDRKTN